jgi:hypothetical protein
MNDPTSTADWAFLPDLMDILQDPALIQQLRDIIDAPYAPYTPAPKKLLTSTIKPVPVDDPYYRRNYYVAASVIAYIDAIQTVLIDAVAGGTDPKTAASNLRATVNMWDDEEALIPGKLTHVMYTEGNAHAYPAPVAAPSMAWAQLVSGVFNDMYMTITRFENGTYTKDDVTVYGPVMIQNFTNLYTAGEYRDVCTYYRLPCPSLDTRPIPPYEPLGEQAPPPITEVDPLGIRLWFDISVDIAYVNSIMRNATTEITPDTYRNSNTKYRRALRDHEYPPPDILGHLWYIINNFDDNQKQIRYYYYSVYDGILALRNVAKQSRQICKKLAQGTNRAYAWTFEIVTSLNDEFRTVLMSAEVNRLMDYFELPHLVWEEIPPMSPP